LHHGEPHGHYEIFNKVEGIMWFIVAVALPFYIRPRTGRQKLSIAVASAGFALFGLSDFLEAPFQGQLPVWLWTYKIACAALILSCRFAYIGWRRFRLTDRYVLFALICLGASAGAIYLQHRLYGA
jgi:hypothetical protein